MTARPCVTHHHACDCREAKMAALLVEAAGALDELARRNWAKLDRPPFCSMCLADYPPHGNHLDTCLTRRLRAAVVPGV